MFQLYQTLYVTRQSINQTPALIKIVSQGGELIVVAQTLILISLAVYYLVTDGTCISIKERIQRILYYALKPEFTASPSPMIVEKRAVPILTFTEILRQAVPPIKVNIVTITRMTHHLFSINRANSEVHKAKSIYWLLNAPSITAFTEIKKKSKLPSNEPSGPHSRTESKGHQSSPIEDKNMILPMRSHAYSTSSPCSIIGSPLIGEVPKEEIDTDISIPGPQVPFVPRLNNRKWLKKVYLPKKTVKHITVA
ncbi:hypothetical protein NEOLI_004250 [Neolecta irregularis DAH-3]|uniref:Uncharacterized protein n=1 Tax=Neolecta irregularis (strain DAH-3) TaxID=1198029 RepID=A0A1U7LMJ7_NEOID|nr:hypothetical protein NEOLI_004250 [Neolecta irregularis DAH-3]|eukprot:OLL23741.1 hypothetical protein NEOLI_004250 [Neolecta irregularis DAH-3]